MLKYTLGYPIVDNNVLLGYKRRGHGEGLYCGFGGKTEINESLVDCMIRELEEETSLKTNGNGIQYSGDIEFEFYNNEDMNCIIHIFVIEDWQGSPQDSEEMYTKWFDINEIPYDNMRETDMIWLPYILNLRKLHAKFIYKNDTENVSKFIVHLRT